MHLRNRRERVSEMTQIVLCRTSRLSTQSKRGAHCSRELAAERHSRILSTEKRGHPGLDLTLEEQFQWWHKKRRSSGTALCNPAHVQRQTVSEARMRQPRISWLNLANVSTLFGLPLSRNAH